MSSLSDILAKIAAGEHIPQEQLLPFLCQESQQQRLQVNYALAEAWFRQGNNTELARVFIQRAWLLSDFSEEVLPLYTEIHAALQLFEPIRDARRQAGIKHARQGNIDQALAFFDKSFYTFNSFLSLDKYDYDFEILHCLDQLAEPFRFYHPARPQPPANRKIRLAYLVQGVVELNSVLIKLNLIFAKYHDKSRFDVAVFIPDSRYMIDKSPQGKQHIAEFESYGCRVYTVPERYQGTAEILIQLGKMIYQSRPDMLIVSAALANFKQYLVLAMRPAPRILTFVQGPPPQFAPPGVDWSVSWTKHPLMETPANCTLLNIELELPSRKNVQALSRAEIGLPEEAVVLMTAGRHVKFQDKAYWKVIADIMQQHPQVYYIVIGAKREQIPFIDEIVPARVLERVLFFGWAKDYLAILAQADIVLDTYPSGGGTTLTDAMGLELPVLCFQNNFMRIFDQTDWSNAEELIPLPEVIVPRGDFEKFRQAASKMISDKPYRLKVGRDCHDYLMRTRGQPGRCIHTVEEIYKRVLAQTPADTGRPAVPADIAVMDRYEIGKLIKLFFRTLAWKIFRKIKLFSK